MFGVKQWRKNWKWNWAEHAGLWRSKDQHTSVGVVLRRLVLIGPTISLTNFFIAKKAPEEPEYPATRDMDWFIFCSSAIVTAILFWVSRPDFPAVSFWWRCLLGCIAAYRIFDSMSYRLYYIFFKSSWKPWRESRRSLGIALANLYEAVISYGILFLLSGEIYDGCKRLSGAWNAAYFSATTITTLGYGDYHPTGGFSRFLVITELFTGATFLVVIIPSLVSLLSESGRLTPGAYPAAHLESEIRRRAYERWERRGRDSGCDKEDWLDAENEILGLKHESWFYKPLQAIIYKIWGKVWRRSNRGDGN